MADSNSSPLDIYAARNLLRTLGVDGWQDERDRTEEIRRLQSVISAPDANPLDVYAARERLKALATTDLLPSQSNLKVGSPSGWPTPRQMARYHQVRGLTLLALILLIALLLYWIFKVDRTVDYYLNNYQERIEKIQWCSQVPDITKDKECMNAITAQRMFAH